MAHKIKVGPIDSREFRRSVIELGNYTKKALGKSNVQLFDRETVKLLSGEAEKSLGKMEARSGRLKALMTGYAKKIKESANDSKKEWEYKQKLIQATQRLAELEKNRENLRDAKKNLEQKPSITGGVKEALAEKFPGLTGVLSKLKGVGGLGLLTGGALAGAGYYAYNRMSAGYNRYEGGIESRLGLMGRGVRDTNINPELAGGFARVGMNAEDVRKQRLASMDAFGKEGSTQAAVLQRAQFARNFGIDQGMLTSAGAQMRAQNGTKGANRDILKLQASLQASAIEDAIGPYLESATNLLTDIRQTGMVQSGEVLSTMATLVKQTGKSPERAAAEIAGMQHAVQGSSGENNAFFQTAFARRGIGGRTIGGTQAAIRAGGIFGVSAEDYQGLSSDHQKQLERLGITGKGTGVQDRLGAILGLADQTFGKNPKGAGLLAKGRFMMPKLGAKNEVQAIEMMDQMREVIKRGNPEEMKAFQDKLKKAEGTPEERSLKNLEDINKSQETAVEEMKAIRANQEEAMGKQGAGAATTFGGIKNNLDSGISGSVGRLTNAMFGRPDTVNDLMGRKAEITQEMARAQEAQKYGAQTPQNYEMNMKRLEDQLMQVNSQLQKMTDLHEEHVDTAKEGVEQQKRANRALSKPKATVDMGAGKTQ